MKRKRKAPIQVVFGPNSTMAITMTAEELGTIQYAFYTGVEKLLSSALFLKTMAKKSPSEYKSAWKTANAVAKEAKAVNVALEKAIQKAVHRTLNSGSAKWETLQRLHFPLDATVKAGKLY